ncbi:PIR protein, putative [Plasmodium sp. gorilla clade G1]|nr:PIR protein, putative [Plasmodium sp. gorilla clade G1]
MKVHYISILLFSLPLNILVHNERNHKKTILHTHKTKPTKTYRKLCECELYATSNYENDPEMKALMENYNHQTSERFREYDEKMQDKRKQCKEQCEQDVQKIILKDKIEKQLAQQFSTLQTNIDTTDIPTCVCEQSVADKIEKTCLRCGGILGTAIPELGLIGGNALYAISVWKDAEIATVITAAQKAGEAAGIAAGEIAGIKELIKGLFKDFALKLLGGKPLDEVITSATLKDHTTLVTALEIQYKTTCLPFPDAEGALCFIPENKYANIIKGTTQLLVGKANKTVESVTADVATKTTATLTTKNTTAVEAAVSSYTTAIIASIVAVLVIVLVMVIIYLILRYRRKRKMKKKLQYIKLINQ